MPIIKFRISQCLNKGRSRSERYSQISENLRTGQISLMKEKLVLDDN